jgi:hypothetical protein
MSKFAALRLIAGSEHSQLLRYCGQPTTKNVFFHTLYYTWPGTATDVFHAFITRSLLRHLLHGPCLVCSLLLLVDGDRRPTLERAGVHCVRNGHAVLADGDALVLYDKVAFLACWPRAAGALCRTKHMLTALVSSEQCARPRRVVRATWYRLGQGQAKLWKRPDRSETSLLTATIFRFA